MLNILLTAFASIFKFVGSQIALKFIFFAVVATIFPFFITLIISLLPDSFSPEALTAYFQFMPSGFWYFFHYAKGPEGFQLIMTALIARFLIRRIPFFN